MMSKNKSKRVDVEEEAAMEISVVVMVDTVDMVAKAEEVAVVVIMDLQQWMIHIWISLQGLIQAMSGPG